MSHKNDYFSVWFGNFENEDKLMEYAEQIDPNDWESEESESEDYVELDLTSKFIEDFKIDYYNEDYCEALFKTSTNKYEELLEDIFLEEEISPIIMANLPDLKGVELNSVILISAFKHESEILINKEKNVYFIGAFKLDSGNLPKY